MQTTTPDIFEEYIDKARRVCSDAAQHSGKGKSYAFVRTFGCQQNEADSERLCGALSLIGYDITNDETTADIILVNTCAIREHAEKRALSTVGQYKHLKLQKPWLILGVCGCMAAEEHRRTQIKSSNPYVDFTLPPAGEGLLPKLIYDAAQKRRVFVLPEDTGITQPGCIKPKRRVNTKSWLSIMYGCNNFCSYCIVPYVRGRERSRSRDEVLCDARELVHGGCRDITLLGQNVNSYNGGCDFATLLRDINGIDGDFIVRFMTSHPKDATPELVSAMAECKKVARHIHLPLQSGSDDVLRRMNRKYDRERYLSVISAIRSSVPDISITTDIIVGFPGESEEDFEATLDMLKTVRFDMIYSFIYSPRRGTPAAQLPDQIPKTVQDARFGRLFELQNTISAENNQREVGRVLRVLCEGKSKTNPSLLSGRSDANKLVVFDGDCADGCFTNVSITEAFPYMLRGTELKK